jgi:hypothetical protein
VRKFILLIFFSQYTPLHDSACRGHLEVCRLLVESKADVAARDRCFSPPPPSHHLSLTICLAAKTELHSNAPSAARKPTLLHTCAALARPNDAPPPRCRCPVKPFLFMNEGQSISDHMAWLSRFLKGRQNRKVVQNFKMESGSLNNCFT